MDMACRNLRLLRPASLRFCFALSVCLVAVHAPAWAQTVATHAGRPFVRIARAGVSQPGVGIIQGFGRAQVVGDSVAAAVLGNGFVGQGWLMGRGGPGVLVASVGMSAPEGGAALQRFHDGMAWRGAVGGTPAFVFAAGVTDADGLYRWTADSMTRLIPSGTVLPGSGGLPMNRIGEPFEVGGNLAVIGWHATATGVDFRGVYRVLSGELRTVANTVTALPGAVGVPDAFSSQVGFDGATLAFWASRGAFAAVQGIFKQTSDGAAVTAIVSTGDALPGGLGVIADLISPPTVSGGAVWFCAVGQDRRSHLLRERDGVVTRWAGDGDAVPGGGVLASVGQLGMEAQGNRLFFAARTEAGSGVYVVDDAGLSEVVTAGSIVAGVRPTALTLHDVEGDTVVLATAGPGAQPAMIVANLSAPAVPVIVAPPVGVSLKRGVRAELNVGALGDAPLAYFWRVPSSPTVVKGSSTFVIPEAGAMDVGFYSVEITNQWGSVFSASVQVNVETPPELKEGLTSLTVESGDNLVVRADVRGGLPMAFTWLRDGVPIEGSGSPQPVFIRSPASVADAGLYTLQASNAWGTLTVDVARVSVAPPPPNPVFGGGRFEARVSAGLILPGLTEGLGPEGLTEGFARWLGQDIVFSAIGSDYGSLGLFRQGPAGVRVELPLGGSLPGGLGVLGGVRLVKASSADDPICVVGLSNRISVGIYRTEAGVLTSLVDLRTPVPGAEGEAFRHFDLPAVQFGNALAFVGDTGTRQGVYRVVNGVVQRVLDTRMDLPVLGTTAISVQALGFDGDHVAALVADRTASNAVLLRVGADGAVTTLVKVGDAIPDTSSTVRLIGTMAVEAGRVTFFAFDTGFARHVLQWEDGVLRRLVGPGMTIPGVGTVSAVDSGSVILAGGRVYLSGRLATPTGAIQGAFVADASGLASVYGASKLEGQRATSVSVVDAWGDRVLMAVRFSGSLSGFYGNTAVPGAEPPRLTFTRGPAGGIAVTVPDGTVLESVSSLDGAAWQSVPGSGEVLIPFEGAARFLRLKRP